DANYPESGQRAAAAQALASSSLCAKCCQALGISSGVGSNATPRVGHQGSRGDGTAGRELEIAGHTIGGVDRAQPESLMAYSAARELIIENRHTGERLTMRRVKRGDEVWLELKGTLPAHQQGPPLHIHVAEDEEGVVRSGTLSAVLNGRRFTAGSGERVSFPRGSTHRWWNDGSEPLVFEGYAGPAEDLDRFL